MSGNQDQPLPLAGLKVVEFCQIIMGPSCGVVLADLGADVIKVEPAPGGDKTRKLSGFAAGFFSSFNRNRRSIALNLKEPKGLEIAQKLIAQADVLTENFAPGTMDRLGCGYEDVSKVNPRLVYCSLKGFLSGPYEKRQALDEVVQFMGGLAYMTGPPGHPLRAGASVIDIMGGTFGVVGILAALRERDHSGKGQLVKSALFENVAHLMGTHMSGEAIQQKEVPPMPVRWSAWAVYEVMETSDAKQVFIGITSDNHWRRFCQKFGRSDLLADPDFQTNEDRVAAQERLKPIIRDMIRAHSKSEVLEICEEINIPFAPVAETKDLFDDPQLNANGRMLVTQLPDGRTVKLPRLPIEIGDHDLGLRTQPPEVGEHTREVLKELGYTVDALDKLEDDNIIESRTGSAER
ncbi:MAG: formyl-CoA transferase [Rhodospirillaceae bacterium]|nr:formyl-CoA transferase [Rhodospirillaceae bacterium]